MFSEVSGTCCGTPSLELLFNLFISCSRLFVNWTMDLARSSSLSKCLAICISTFKTIHWFFFSVISSPKFISKVRSDLIKTSSFMFLDSLASYIAITLYAYFFGNDLKVFLTSFSSDIFSPSTNASLVKSHSLALNSLIVSSSHILRFSNLAVKSCNLDNRMVFFASKAVWITSHTFLADLHVEINLNSLGAIVLKITSWAFEL